MPSSWNQLDRHTCAWIDSWDKDVWNGVTSLPAAEKALSEGAEPPEMGKKSLAARETLLKWVQFLAHQLKTSLSSPKKTVGLENHLVSSS